MHDGSTTEMSTTIEPTPHQQYKAKLLAIRGDTNHEPMTNTEVLAASCIVSEMMLTNVFKRLSALENKNSDSADTVESVLKALYRLMNSIDDVHVNRKRYIRNAIKSLELVQTDITMERMGFTP